MKIGVDCHNLEGTRTGVGRYLFNLLSQWSKFDLAPFGVNFILYFKQNIPEDIPQNPHFTKKLLKAPFGIQSNAFFTHFLLSKAMGRDKLDLLFCPNYIAPIFCPGKIALTLHDIIYEARPSQYNWPSWADKILLRWVSRQAAKKAKVIFTPSQFSKDEVIKYYHIDPRKVHATHLAADDEFKKLSFNKLVETKFQQTKKSYGIKDKFILYVGSIFNRRHVPELIKAFERISKKIPNYQLLLVGRNFTSPFIDIEKLVTKTNQKLKRDAVLQFNSPRKTGDLVLLYNMAKLFVYLSSYEGFGLPPLESMASGTPVVTTNISSIPEVVGNSAILLNDPTDINEISKALYKGLADKKLREELIEKGLERVKRFSWKKCAEKTLHKMLKC